MCIYNFELMTYRIQINNLLKISDGSQAQRDVYFIIIIVLICDTMLCLWYVHTYPESNSTFIRYLFRDIIIQHT